MAGMGFGTPAGRQPSFLEKLQMGLLGQSSASGASETQQKEAQRQGLLALGAQLLASSGPSTQRTSFGQALGPALMAGQQARNSSLEQALQSQLMQSQIQRAQQKERGKLVPIAGEGGQPVYEYEENAVGKQPYMKPGNEFGAYQPGDYTPESWAKFMQSKDPAALVRYTTPRQDYAPSYQQITRTLEDGSTQQGRFDTRSGNPEWFGDVVPAGTKAQVDAAGRTKGKATADAQIDLQRAEDTTSQALGAIQELKGHPGLKYITGAWSAAPIVPGTPQAGADALAQQIQGKTFLEAFGSLKGGGAITEVEGTKAEAAIARLQRAQSRREYIQALGELEGVLNIGLERARKKAGAGSAPTRIRVDEQGNPL